VARPKKERPEKVAQPSLGAGQAERLTWTRKERDWSLYDLSAASGVSVRTIRDIESGEKGGTSAEIMAKLADALHVSRCWLTFGG
jgi:transcriptional regulator with XRE-family HTH domain